MKNDIQEAIKALRQGGTILYPTDTIWGLGCDACNAEAVNKLYEIKQRDGNKSMLILVDSVNMLERYVDVVPEIAYEILEVNEEPLTIIYPEAKNLAKNLVADDGSIAIRITNEEFSRNLISVFRKPIVSTSANFSGVSPAQNYSDIDERLKDKVDFIVKYRRDELINAKASGIIKLGNSGEIEIIRK